MIGIDLFSGAGGMSIGAIRAGVKIHLAIEKDFHAATTYANNHPNTKILNEDISKIDFHLLEIPERDVILFGGPPCQGFSTSNQKNRNKDNDSNWLFLEFIRAIKEIEPEWVVFENVKGIIETESGHFYKLVKNRLNGLGYKYKSYILNSADFGVPQRRNRVFIIARKEKSFKIKFDKIKDRTSVRDAIYDLPELENGANESILPYRCEAHSSYAKLMRRADNQCSSNIVTRNNDVVIERYMHVPEGGNWENIPENLLSNYSDSSRCHTGLYHRLIWQEPSIVIGNFRKNMLIHPAQHRGLSVREAARIQSFPDNYDFSGSIGFQQQQVGNAVPPILSEQVFMRILQNA